MLFFFNKTRSIFCFYHVTATLLNDILILKDTLKIFLKLISRVGNSYFKIKVHLYFFQYLCRSSLSDIAPRWFNKCSVLCDQNTNTDFEQIICWISTWLTRSPKCICPILICYLTIYDDTTLIYHCYTIFKLNNILEVKLRKTNLCTCKMKVQFMPACWYLGTSPGRLSRNISMRRETEWRGV